MARGELGFACFDPLRGGGKHIDWWVVEDQKGIYLSRRMGRAWRPSLKKEEDAAEEERRVSSFVRLSRSEEFCPGGRHGRACGEKAS